MFYVKEVRSVSEFEMDRSLINHRETSSVGSALIKGYTGMAHGLSRAFFA